jgi:hypothetical protein
MRFTPAFYRFAAICSIASALTTLGLIFLPGTLPPADDFAARMLLWGATEAGQQALTLFAFNPWRIAWLAGDTEVRATMAVRTAVYDGLWNAMYFLLIVGFFIANALYAAALWRRGGWSRVVGGFFAAAAALTLAIIVIEVGGPQLLADPVDFWLYPLIQPLARHAARATRLSVAPTRA